PPPLDPPSSRGVSVRPGAILSGDRFRWRHWFWTALATVASVPEPQPNPISAMLRLGACLGPRSPGAPMPTLRREHVKWSPSPRRISDSNAREPALLGVTSPTRRVFTRNMNITSALAEYSKTPYSGLVSGRTLPELTISTPRANHRWKVSSVMMVARLVATLRLQITVTIEASSPHFSIQMPARLPQATRLIPNDAIM